MHICQVLNVVSTNKFPLDTFLDYLFQEYVHLYNLGVKFYRSNSSLVTCAIHFFFFFAAVFSAACYSGPPGLLQCSAKDGQTCPGT